ncbi:hypothetical protein AM202_0215 [Actinobacillus minor 202]|uniref:Outer membrane antigenic lipoprotein B n=1 Tax=Actinobacillus minor 202 TaxID=591023 RepID=A0ABM9XIJ7_9PAST|nr:hypothetical protein [Actinobacillus minor]EEF15990.1 hypothetical protein AM202_0215 [Actinobacillus minor 202]
MKKIVSLFVLSSAFLTACSSSEQPKTDANKLSPGVMQPVNGSGASEGSFGWESDIQSAPMPSTMK